MKESRFNSFYPAKSNQKKILAYNARSNALATIDLENFEELKKCFQTRDYEILEKGFREELEKGYFLIEDSVDELEILRYNQQMARYNSTYLGLTIAPTLGCNFDCVYCYEKEHNDFYIMDVETQELVLNFIEKYCKTINQLSISWYGGEPLLAFDLIKEFSYKVINLCQKYNISYSANIVTNGYLLTKEIAEELQNINVHSIQITLDGPEDIHDTRRFLQGGQGTFKKIIKNLKDTIDYLPNTSIRINVDKENYNRIYEIIDILKENNLQKLLPYLGYVEPTNELYDEEHCLTVNKFGDIDFYFNKTIRADFQNNKYPKLVANNCCADSINSFVIDPKGNIYKCWSDIGIEKYCLGNISETFDNKSRIYEYALYDPTEDEECKYCSILPICMGGCPRRRIDNLVDRCSAYKYNLEPYLQEIFDNYTGKDN